jgi:hypothetical protein
MGVNGDDYTDVWCTIAGVTERAVRVTVEGESCWVPRSVLHGAQERDIEHHIGENMQLKIRSWFAKRENLI